MVQKRNNIESVEDTGLIDGIEKMTISDSAVAVLKSSSKENFAPLDQPASCRSSYSHGLPQKPNRHKPSFMQATASWRGKGAKERKQEGGSRSKPKWVNTFVEKKGSDKVISLLNDTRSADDTISPAETFDCDVPRYMRPTKTRMSKLRRSDSFVRSSLSKTTWRSATPDMAPFSEVTNAHRHRS